MWLLGLLQAVFLEVMGWLIFPRQTMRRKRQRRAAKKRRAD